MDDGGGHVCYWTSSEGMLLIDVVSCKRLVLNRCGRSVWSNGQAARDVGLLQIRETVSHVSAGQERVASSRLLQDLRLPRLRHYVAVLRSLIQNILIDKALPCDSLTITLYSVCLTRCDNRSAEPRP